MKLFLSSAPQFLCAELTLEDSLVFSSSQRGMPVLNNSQDFRIPRVRRIQQGTGTGGRQCKGSVCNPGTKQQHHQFQIWGIPQSCVFQAEPLLLSAGLGPYFCFGQLRKQAPYSGAS